ncbi:hypothetical protein CRE_29349 [Caenorhabditis remanei]|uniref:Uncharacterized protein n=1 Tax=Caenorhabditis remanei TaxID=31234 RepID=E3MY09_CAERE|nr:hypothetical protein CRE_29349 [Caenorhabditis remanei]
MDASSFPLFCLPDKAIQNSMRCMEPKDIINITFCSNSTKHHGKCLNIKPLECFICIDQVVQIQVLIKPCRIFHSFLIPDTLEIKSFLDHMVHLFGNPKIDIYIHSTLMDFDSMRVVFGELNVNCLYVHPEDMDYAFYKKILNQFSKSAKQLDLSSSQHPMRDFHDVLIQNYDYISIEPMADLKIDDLLIMNSLSIYVIDSQLTDKDINRFLKHWISGANTRLEHIYIEFQRRSNEEVFKGIKRRMVSPRRFEGFIGGARERRVEELTDGIEIWNEKRTKKATIKFKRTTVKMFVWH